jgi:hypothetical protein|tara:strand:- start:227 stop:1750 length:1524 start_codon:yes stop_codon:yes gene_type:complete
MKHIRVTVIVITLIINYGCETSTESDTTPPDVSISSPADGITVSDTVSIKALVADNEGVKSVEFYIDGELLSSDSQEPFEVEWITNNSSNGSHTLHCKAVDNSDNEALSESITVVVENVLLTASFINNWLCDSCGEGILFYSDMEGNLLWSGTWTGNESIQVLPTEDNPNFPERVMVTTINDDGYNNVYITTNMYVKPESWTWKGVSYRNIENQGDVTLDLHNIPNHQGYLVASKWNRRSSNGTIYNGYTKSLYETNDDLYIRLNTNNSGPQYLWVENVTPGQTVNIDLSNMANLISKTITFPMNFANISFYIRGLFDQGYYDGYYQIENTWGDQWDQENNTYTAYYPTSLFSDFRTVVYMNEEDYPTFNWWGYWKIGDQIPDAMQKMNADFEFISTSPDNFEIQITGEYNSTGSGWSFDDGNNIYNWAVYGEIQSYELPNFPIIATQKYPGIDNHSFALENTLIAYRPDIEDNDELMQILFQSDYYYYDVIHESFERSKDPDGLAP